MMAAIAGALAILASGCGSEEPDLENGKRLFTGEGRCGSCHVLERAGTRSTVGPSLDAAFKQAREDGLDKKTIEEIVYRQILQPRNSSAMPEDLVTGQDARDVAAYVAQAAAKPGEDEGQLARIGVRRSEEVARADGGQLEIPADPDGALAYTFGSAQAEAGQVTLRSPNESSVPHNIALEGGGVNEEGEVVQDGGVSTVEAEVRPGEYTFFCSVPGHREGGMEGTLTVK
jgi:plastocyanin